MASHPMVVEPMQFSVDGQDTECLRFAAPQASQTAYVLLSDIFGVHQEDTQAVAKQFAEATNSAAYVPDMFRGDPWPKSKQAGTSEFEKWRNGLPAGWAIKVGLAAGRLAKQQGATRVALVGFCFGGGQLVSVLADADQGQAQDAPAFCGGVAFYGTRIDADKMRHVRSPMKLLFASEDTLVPQEQRDKLGKAQQELQRHNVACEIRVFEGVGHGFAHQDAAADTQERSEARRTAIEFLTSVL